MLNNISENKIGAIFFITDNSNYYFNKIGVILRKNHITFDCLVNTKIVCLDIDWHMINDHVKLIKIK